MKKRQAKKINKNPQRYSVQQLRKAFKQLRSSGLTVSRNHGLVAGEVVYLDPSVLPGLARWRPPYEKSAVTVTIEDDGFTFSPV